MLLVVIPEWEFEKLVLVRNAKKDFSDFLHNINLKRAQFDYEHEKYLARTWTMKCHWSHEKSLNEWKKLFDQIICENRSIMMNFQLSLIIFHALHFRNENSAKSAKELKFFIKSKILCLYVMSAPKMNENHIFLFFVNMFHFFRKQENISLNVEDSSALLHNFVNCKISENMMLCVRRILNTAQMRYKYFWTFPWRKYM